jgi:hypothetical protein
LREAIMHILANRRSLTLRVSLVLGVLLAAGSPAGALTLDDLNMGGSFTTANDLLFSDFSVVSATLDPSVIDVDVLSDGFSFSFGFDDSDVGSLDVSYLVSNVGGPAVLSLKKSTGPVFLFASSTSPMIFSDSGSVLFPVSGFTEASVAMEGELLKLVKKGNNQFVSIDFETLPAKKKAVGPFAFGDSLIDFQGAGEVEVEYHWSIQRPIPEPSAAIVFLTGLALVAGRIRRG